MTNYVVTYTPGPPAIGVLTKLTVEAADASAARAVIRSQHRWVMIHRVQPAIEGGCS